MPDLKFCGMNVLIRFLVDFTPLAFPDHVREYLQNKPALMMIPQLICTLSPDIILSQDVDGQVKHIQCQKVV